MVYLHEMGQAAHDRILSQELPNYGPTECRSGPPLVQRRIAIVTTSGLHRRTDKPFSLGVGEYRIIPADTGADELIMSHISSNFDRTGFQQDINVVFPIDRLRELAADGVIDEVAAYHFAFMGATPPDAHQTVARDIAGLLLEDKVNGVVLAGV